MRAMSLRVGGALGAPGRAATAGALTAEVVASTGVAATAAATFFFRGARGFFAFGAAGVFDFASDLGDFFGTAHLQG